MTRPTDPENMPDDADDIVVKRVFVTPEMAGDWFALNTNNRPIVASRVNQIAQAIARGEWVCNGDTIKLANDRLLDGQHRLLAVQQAGIGIDTFVAWKLPPDVFVTIDTNRPRSPGDTLGFLGYKRSNRLAAVVRLQWLYETVNGNPRASAHTPTRQQLVEVVARHPRLEDAIRLSERARVVADRAYLAFLLYQFSIRDEGAAELFTDLLGSGANLAEDHPVYRLRERLLSDRVQLRKPSWDLTMALTIKAWNAFYYRTPLRQLKWRSADESWPSILPDRDKRASW